MSSVALGIHPRGSGEIFSPDVLASIAPQIQETIGADEDVSEEEQAFVDGAIERWQIDPGEPDECVGRESGEVSAALST